MPPNPLPHIVRWLIDMGIAEGKGMGSAPLSWHEIAAWQALTGINLAPWEARLIRTLSSDYLAEARRAERDGCPPPFRTAPTASEIETETAKLRRLFDEMMAM